MSLSLREREVMALVVCGRLNKQVAGELAISEITVKSHRGKMMQKMQVDSVADLVNIAARLRIAPQQGGLRTMDCSPFAFLSSVSRVPALFDPG